MTKSPWKSVTLWVNLVGALGVAALGVMGEHGFGDAQWYVLALAAANMALRFKTTQPIV